jgi:O-antigen/teichoic acid export membrane protein
MTTIFVFILSKNIFSFILKDYLKETKQLIRFGIQLVLNNGTYFLDTNVDTIIVGYFLTSQEVGIYSIAIMFAQLLFVIPGAIAQVTYPVLTELYNKKLKSAMKSTLSKSIKYSFFITSILGLALILFSSNIISILLPPVFQEAVIPLNIIRFSLILYAPFTSIGSLWNAVGKPHIVSIFGITWVTINAAVNVALIPILGILGAAIATSTTYIIRPFPAVYLWKRLLNIDIDQWWYVKSWGILGLLVIIFFYFKSYINADLLKIIIFLVWIGCLSQLLISKEEKQEIIELIKHLFKNLNF